VRREVAVVVAIAALLAGCGHGGHSTVSLDGTARVPDDEGIVTAVDLTSVTLDGDRTYRVEDDLVSFSNIDLQPVPLLYTQGQYVQVGADGHTARWIGTVAKPLGTKPPTVLYAGTIRSVDHGRLVFANGTVLRVAGAVDVTHVRGKHVDVRLRPDAREITEMEAR
jgi:hypothetical protein